jgi:hypothetical protein
MLRKAACLAAVFAIAFAMPMPSLRAGSTTTVTALPAAPASVPENTNLDGKQVVATPIPEPSSVVLAAGALAWCFWRGRRRVATLRRTPAIAG